MANNIIFPSSAGFFPVAGGGGGGGAGPSNVYEVSPDGTLPYTSIQAAIDAAVADGYDDALFNSAIVAIYPGIYNETVTCHNGIHLAGIYNGGFGQVCGIIGGITFAPEPAVSGFESAAVRITGLFVIGDGQPALQLVDAGDGNGGMLAVDGCQFLILDGEGGIPVVKQDLTQSFIFFGFNRLNGTPAGTIGFEQIAGQATSLQTLSIEGAGISTAHYVGPGASFEGVLDVRTADYTGYCLYVDAGANVILHHGSKLRQDATGTCATVCISDNAFLLTYGTYWSKDPMATGGKQLITDGTGATWFRDNSNVFMNNDEYDTAITAILADTVPTAT